MVRRVIAFELVQLHTGILVGIGVFIAAMWSWAYHHSREGMRWRETIPKSHVAIIASAVFAAWWWSTIVPDYPRTAIYYGYSYIAMVLNVVLLSVAVFVAASERAKTKGAGARLFAAVAIAVVAGGLAYLWLVPHYLSGWAYASQAQLTPQMLVDSQGRRRDAIMWSPVWAAAGWYFWILGLAVAFAVWTVYTPRLRYKRRKGPIKARYRFGLAVIIVIVALFTVSMVGAINLADALAGWWLQLWQLPYNIPTDFNISGLFSPDSWQNVQGVLDALQNGFTWPTEPVELAPSWVGLPEAPSEPLIPPEWFGPLIPTS